jgi:hypothetical protein
MTPHLVNQHRATSRDLRQRNCGAALRRIVRDGETTGPT